MFALKLRKIGNSLGVVLPKEALASLKTHEGEPKKSSLLKRSQKEKSIKRHWHPGCDPALFRHVPHLNLSFIQAECSSGKSNGNMAGHVRGGVVNRVSRPSKRISPCSEMRSGHEVKL